MEKIERTQVLDILDKMNFFQGQRAGRELWNDKPVEVQEQDLESFNKDIRTIRDYIWDLEKELKSYKDLEEQGLLLKLHFGIGDIVYEVVSGADGDCSVVARKCRTKAVLVALNEKVGKTVFLTKSEAEKALEEMGCE